MATKEDIFHSWLESSELPILTAFILGLLNLFNIIL